MLVGGKFFSAFTLTLILQQVAIVGIVGAAQTLVILTAGIDLSVGAIMVLSSVVMGQFTFRYGVPAPIRILCGFAVGALCGWLNGVLIAHMKLPPFIVTLGTWQIILGDELPLLGQRDDPQPGHRGAGAAAAVLRHKLPDRQCGVHLSASSSWCLLVLSSSGTCSTTPPGAGMSTRSATIPRRPSCPACSVKRMLVSVYVLSGLICALAGWVLIGRIGSVSPTSGQFANIESITAVVIGGISLFGGRGSILGTMFGALIVGVFSLGLRLIGTDPQWTYLLIGVLIIVAVAIDQWIRKVSG